MTKKISTIQGYKVKADRLALESCLEEAQVLYAKVCKIVPNDIEAWVKLGETQRRLGRYKNAELSGRRAVRLAPNEVLAHQLLAVSLHSQRKFSEAITVYRKAIQLKPTYSPSYYLLGNALMELGKLPEAVDYLSHAIKLHPNFFEALSDLGAALLKMGRVDLAPAVLKRALALNPNSPEVLANLGSLLEMDGRVEEALELYQNTLRLRPDALDVIAKQAELLEKIGRLEEANELLERGLARNSKHPALNLIAARVERREGNYAGAVARLEGVLSQPIAHAISGDIHLLLGVLYDCLGQTDKVMSHLSEGKRRTASAADPDGTGRLQYLEKITITRAWLSDRLVKSIVVDDVGTTESPVFLIGFPRSGTTLLEQILDSHPVLQTMEEKPAVAAMEKAFLIMTAGNPEALTNLDQQQVDILRHAYFEEVSLNIVRRPGMLLVDKLPLNIVRVPLLWRVFPEARFILAIRHPCDVILSCFMQNFAKNDAMCGFVNLESITEIYVQVMGAWLDYVKCLPLYWHPIRYEDLITNFKPESKALLDFLGVGWHDAVLNHTQHAQQKSIIQTPSYHQVTKPIYMDAMYRWQRYEKDFVSVIKELYPFIQHFGYKQKL